MRKNIEEIILATVMLMVFIMSGCKPTREITEKHYKTDSTIVRYEPVMIEIPPSEVVQDLPVNFYDSVQSLLAQRPPDQRVIYQTDPTMQTRLSFFLDSLGRLQARCETLEKQYEDSIQSILRIVKEIDHRTVREEVKPGFFEKAKIFINSFAWIIVIAGMALLFLKR